MSVPVDAVVMGLGPGGEEVAGRLAQAGLEVVGIDGGLVGGECPYWGCVPSKMMIRAANLLAEGRRIEGMAGRSEVTPDWSVVARRIRQEATDDWDDQVAVERLQGKGARFVRGWARLLGRRAVEVEGEVFEARRAIVLDTGASPWLAPVPGLSDTGYWTNRHAVEAMELPRSLTVLGGGAIGAELGQVFSRFGVAVTVVEAADRLLALEEPEAGELLAGVFGEEGIAVHTGARITGARQDADGIVLDLDGVGPIAGERLLAATGRRPDLAALGVAALGLDDTARALPVDEHMRVADGVWAVGDVTGKGAFTHMSMYQAAIAVDDILGGGGPGAKYHAVPRVTFTDPEIGSVGMSEADARSSGLEVRTGSSQIPSSSRGWIHKAGNAGFVKLVEDARRGVLVGATSAGPTGGEVLGLLTLAVHAAVPVDELARMIYAYPTFHRAVEDAVRDLREPQQ
ncbi:MAG TPA: NAD(P)/FAD-dependent oxidoreductase [Acidimicrobiales bacterium]|nr:NAD(P)/FAD-dependent oxidoreductase [Acidimicrobiales bacterium]